MLRQKHEDKIESKAVLSKNNLVKILILISKNSLENVKYLELQSGSSGRFLEFMALMKETVFSELFPTEIKGGNGYVYDISYTAELLHNFHITYKEIKVAHLSDYTSNYDLQKQKSVNKQDTQNPNSKLPIEQTEPSFDNTFTSTVCERIKKNGE